MIVLAKQGETAEWNYEERDYWPYQDEINNNQCDGERQSPIDIDTSDVYDEKTAPPLVFTGMLQGFIVLIEIGCSHAQHSVMKF